MYGPGSARVSLEISKLDNFLKGLITKYESKVEDLNVVIIADHGMTFIREKFDVQSRIHTLPLVPRKDYIEFYDSTVARFWAFNEKSKLMLTETLSKIPNGRIVEKDELQKSGLLFGDARYGDIIFQMNEGSLIFPNYFTSIIPKFVRTAKGMHGYDGSNRSQKALFCYYGPKSSGLKGIKENKGNCRHITKHIIMYFRHPNSLKPRRKISTKLKIT